MKRVTYFLISASLCLFLNACDNEDNRPITQADTQAIALSEAFIFDGFNIANNIGTSSQIPQGEAPEALAANVPAAVPQCATITIEKAIFPIKVVKQYNEDGCFEDGASRKGKLTVELTRPWWEVGAKLTIIPEDYYVNGIKVEGEQTYENTSANATVFSYKVTISNGKLTAGTYTHTWNCERTITIDNVHQQYTMSGNGRGVTWTGLNYALDITQQFVRRFDCAYVGKGVLEITYGSNKAVLDYGDGTCDNKATYTVGDNIYEITLGLEE